jgi:hypothetical protein
MICPFCSRISFSLSFSLAGRDQPLRIPAPFFRAHFCEPRFAALAGDPGPLLRGKTLRTRSPAEPAQRYRMRILLSAHTCIIVLIVKFVEEKNAGG